MVDRRQPRLYNYLSLTSGLSTDVAESTALLPQVRSQEPQYFSSSETLATYDGCFVNWSICSIISLDFGKSRIGDQHEALMRGGEHCHVSPV